MYSIANLVQLIKKAAYEAIEASKPAKFSYGVVVSIKPLSIRIDPKLTLSSDFLVITQNFSKHEIILSQNENRTSFIVENDLVIGDKVVLLQQKGGQKYLILDRMVQNDSSD